IHWSWPPSWARPWPITPPPATPSANTSSVDLRANPPNTRATLKPATMLGRFARRGDGRHRSRPLPPSGTESPVFLVYGIGMTAIRKTRRGRPPKGLDKIRGVRLDMRLEPAEKEAFRGAAALAGLDLSGWIRERLRTLARKEQEGAGKEVPFLA